MALTSPRQAPHHTAVGRWLPLLLLSSCDRFGPAETGRDSDVSAETSVPVESGLDTSQAPDSSGTDSFADTAETGGDTGPLVLSGEDFECGNWETGAAPQGHVQLRDADLVLASEEGSPSITPTNALGADTDGDGCAELMVATSYNSDAVTRYLWLLPGTLAGEVLVRERNVAVIRGGDEHYLEYIAVGDLDGDGARDEWVLGASAGGYPTDGFTGAVYLFPSPLEGGYREEDAEATLWSPEDSDHFSQALSVGDQDADGLDDVAVGWGYYDGSYRTRALVFAAPLEGDTLDSDAAASLEGEDGFGERLSMEGDLDGDGYADLVPTAYMQDGGGCVYVFFGPVTGAFSMSDADRAMPGEGSYWRAGYGISGGADANGDGYDDLLIAASGEDVWKVYLVAGPVREPATLPGAEAVITGGGSFGQDGVSLPQDVDADGFPDPLMGAVSNSALSWDPRGAAFLFYGPVSGSHDALDADAIFYEDDEDWGWGHVGDFVTGLGDTDGDGYDDILVDLLGSGPAFVFRGGPR